MSYCPEVCGWQKEEGTLGQAALPTLGNEEGAGEGGSKPGFGVNSEPSPSPPWFDPAEGRMGQFCLSPCPPPRGGVPSTPPALTCMWLRARGATSLAFGDALGTDPASSGSWHRRWAMRRWAAAEPFSGDRTGHPQLSPSTPGGSAVTRGGRARGLWGHVKTARQKFRAQVTRQINIVSLSDLTGR